MADPATITVAFEELEDSPSTIYNPGGRSRSRKLKCDWDDAETLADQLIGRTYVDAGVIKFIPPNPFPGDTSCVVSQVKIDPFNSLSKDAAPTGSGSTILNRYKSATLSVEYGSPQIQTYETEDEEEEVYASESLEPFVEMLSIPGRRLFWGDGSPLDDLEVPSVCLTGFTYVWTRYRIANIPAIIMNLVGNFVNNAGIYSPVLNYTFPAETLLFAPPTIERDITLNGENLWKISIKLIYRSSTWNKFFNPKTGLFANVYLKNNATSQFKPYTPASFAGLFV